MNVFDEAKELMKKAGCEKAFAVYGIKLPDIVEVKNCNEDGGLIELERNISELVPTIEQKLVVDLDKPIECPLNTSMNKYLEFSLKTRSIIPYNLSDEERKRIEEEMEPLLGKYHWTIGKK